MGNLNMTVGELLWGQWFKMGERTLMRTKAENRRGQVLCVSVTGDVLHVHKNNTIDTLLGTRLVGDIFSDFPEPDRVERIIRDCIEKHIKLAAKYEGIGNIPATIELRRVANLLGAILNGRMPQTVRSDF